MKRLLLIALLGMTSSAVKAQYVHNDNGCDIEYREFCVDASGSPTCKINYTTGWITVSANTIDPLTTTCSFPDYQGFEVRYASTTGCTSQSVLIQLGATCTGIPWSDYLPGCSCNSGINPDIHVHFNGSNLHISQ